MSTPLCAFEARYSKALADFLALSDEVGLEEAYELGREAITHGLGVLDLAAVHSRALSGARTPAVVGEAASESHRAWQFFEEALGPFEMALRGFRETNTKLKEVTAALEARVAERTKTLTSTERALREQTRILRGVLDSMSDGIAVADRTGKFLVFNKTGERIVGVKPGDAGGPADWPSHFGIFREDGSTPFPAEETPLARAIRGEQTEAVAMFLRNPMVPQGAHLSIIGSPLRNDLGDVEGGVAVFRDVTDAKRTQDTLRKTEEQLRQSQKMDAIGRLAGGVAHDFNNILSVILSYGEMLLADLKPGEPMRADVEEIHKAGRRASDLTRQLLMFSRQQVLEPKVLDLNDLLTSMDRMLQRILGADVDLVSLPGNKLGRVKADPGSVEQVVLNLVVNARDAMPTGGQLTIETANVVLDEQFASQHPGATPGPHVMLAVSDTGIGMDSATKSRIFEPFFTTKEKGKGTGLGLSTVFGIVQQAGGSVWVYSEPGKGSTFKVYLPRVDATADRTPSEAPPPDSRGAETLLLVDDDDQVRLVACAILRRQGYHVIDARNAGEALMHCETFSGDIDLLVTDVVMPQMSGPQLARRLQTLRPRLKVLCMSGYTDDSIVRHGVLEAHIAYLQKPVTPKTLSTKVRAVLDGNGVPPKTRGRDAT